MQAYVKIINNIVLQELKDIKDYKLIKFINFPDPKIYLEVYKHIKEYLDNNSVKLIAKLSKEKYNFWQESDQHQNTLLEMNNLNIIEKSEHLTKWRNYAFNNANSNVVIFLMGTELVEDQGGLEDFFTISPEVVEREVGNNYCKIFNEDANIDFNEDDSDKINNVYNVIFKLVEKDLIKLSYFVEDCNKLNDIKAFIDYIYCSLYKWWGIPNIRGILGIGNINDNFSNTFKILENAYKFNRRIGLDNLPSKSKLETIKEGIYNYKITHETEIDNDFTYMFPNYTDYEEFKKDLLDYIQGMRIDEVKSKLSACDFTVINSILKFRKSKPTPKPKKEYKIYGDPINAFLVPVLTIVSELDKEEKLNYNLIKLKIKQISLSNTKGKDDEQLKSKWRSMCRFLGGIDNLVTDLNLVNKSDEPVDFNCVAEDVKNNELQRIYPLKKDSINELLDSGILKSGSANEQKSKVKFRIEVYFDDKRLEFIDYEWNIFDTDSWINLFNILDNDTIENLLEEQSFIPVGVSKNVNSMLDAMNEEEFVHLIINSNMEYKNIVPPLDRNNKLLTQANLFGQTFKELLQVIDKEGLFTSYKQKSISRDFINRYNDLIKKMIDDIDNLINTEYIYQLSKAFMLLNQFNENSKEILGAVIPPYHPVMLEKIIERYTYLGNGFKELYDEILESDNLVKSNKIQMKFDRFDQLSTITFAADFLLGQGSNMMGCDKTFGFYSIYGQSEENYNQSSINLEYFNSFDIDDIKGQIPQTPISRFISKVILDYIKAYPSKIDGITLMFLEPKDFKNIISGLKHTIDKLKAIDRMKIKLIIYTRDFRSKGKEYIRKWIDNNITEDDNISIEPYIRYIEEPKGDIERYIKENLKPGDIIFLQDIMRTIEISEEPTQNKLQTEHIKENRYPAVYLPIPTNDHKRRMISISQPQFACEYYHSQLLIYLKNRNIRKDKYRIIKHVNLEKTYEEMVRILHQMTSWVVILDQNIDARLINYDSNKIIGFSTGEGYFGELNTTISTTKKFLNDLERFIYKRLRYRFNTWELEELRTAAKVCIDNSDKLDGAQIIKAINPNDQAINNYLAYLLTAKLERLFNLNKNKYYLRKLISLDTYSHLFDEEILLESNRPNLRPDFLLIEIAKEDNDLGSDKDLNIRMGIIECKVGAHGEDRIIEASNQLDSGYKRLSKIWSKNNDSVQKRFWNNQLYRILAYNNYNEFNSDVNYNDFTNKLNEINEGKYNIEYSCILFTYWIDREISNGVRQNNIKYDSIDIEHIEVGNSRIKHLLTIDDCIGEITHSYIQDSQSSTNNNETNLNVNGEHDTQNKHIKISDTTNEENDLDSLNEVENTRKIKDNSKDTKEKEAAETLDDSNNCNDHKKHQPDNKGCKDKLIIDEELGVFNDINNGAENEEDDIENKKNTLKLELQSRKVKVYPKEHVIGPDIIRISLELGSGVNIDQVKKYKEDMKLWLSVNELPFIFIEDGMVKLDIVRENRKTVGIKSVLKTIKEYDKKYDDYKDNFYALLGVDILGNPYVIDFSDSNTPHLLIAGQTGSGKSVLLTSILTSIMTFYKEDEVEMFLVDPKYVELTNFLDSPFTKEVATEVDEALDLLESLVNEMDERYKLFMKKGVKNIYQYNKKVKKEDKLKRVLMVFDEYAAMMEAGSDSVKRIESAIKVLSQKARAAGIHLIICTQSPRADIITTTIRNNLTARVGLRTADGNASSLILDQKGAESLLGKGDMWLKTASTSNLIRLKSPYVTGEEVERLISLVKQRGV